MYQFHPSNPFSLTYPYSTVTTPTNISTYTSRQQTRTRRPCLGSRTPYGPSTLSILGRVLRGGGKGVVLGGCTSRDSLRFPNERGWRGFRPASWVVSLHFLVMPTARVAVCAGAHGRYMSGVRGLLGRALRIVFSASWVSGLGLTEGLLGGAVIAIAPGEGFPN